MVKQIAEWDVQGYEDEALISLIHNHGGDGDVDNFVRGTTSYLFLLKNPDNTYCIKNIECLPDPAYENDWAAVEEVFYQEEYSKNYTTLKEAIDEFQELGEDFCYETGMIDDEWKYLDFEKEVSRIKKTI